MSRKVLALLCVIVVAVLSFAALAYAYSTTYCNQLTGEWWITLYDNNDNITGTFHGVGGHVCPIPAPIKG